MQVYGQADHAGHDRAEEALQVLTHAAASGAHLRLPERHPPGCVQRHRPCRVHSHPEEHIRWVPDGGSTHYQNVVGHPGVCCLEFWRGRILRGCSRGRRGPGAQVTDGRLGPQDSSQSMDRLLGGHRNLWSSGVRKAATHRMPHVVGPAAPPPARLPAPEDPRRGQPGRLVYQVPRGQDED